MQSILQTLLSKYSNKRHLKQTRKQNLGFQNWNPIFHVWAHIIIYNQYRLLVYLQITNRLKRNKPILIILHIVLSSSCKILKICLILKRRKLSCSSQKLRKAADIFFTLRALCCKLDIQFLIAKPRKICD